MMTMMTATIKKEWNEGKNTNKKENNKKPCWMVTGNHIRKVIVSAIQ